MEPCLDIFIFKSVLGLVAGILWALSCGSFTYGLPRCILCWKKCKISKYCSENLYICPDHGKWSEARDSQPFLGWLGLIVGILVSIFVYSEQKAIYKECVIRNKNNVEQIEKTFQERNQ